MPRKIQGIDFIDPRAKTPKGTTIYLDDFALSAPLKGATKLQWQASDLSGVGKFRVALDKAPDTIPTEETTDSQREIPGEAGTYFLHFTRQRQRRKTSARQPIFPSRLNSFGFRAESTETTRRRREFLRECRTASTCRTICLLISASPRCLCALRAKHLYYAHDYHSAGF